MAERVLKHGWTYATVTDKIVALVLSRPTGLLWLALFGFGFLGTLVFLSATSYLFLRGVGIWGLNVPVAWGFAIANYVWWIGIGNAGTFISTFLLLSRQKWRTSVNRFAEAMTLFAVTIAGIFPILHLGRPWFFYWLAPYPNIMELWPQWRSALVWDFFAVAAYLTASTLFWYTGLLPDLATLRDRARSRAAQLVYGFFALGWRGEARHWARYEKAYLLCAGMITALVVSVHSVVALDFAIALVPGYHSTVFPPYFVAGALYSGFAMVFTLAIPTRHFFKLHDFITEVHLENGAKIMLAAGLIVAYGYFTETFTAYYSGDRYELYMINDRMFGNYAPLYWAVIACNVIIPQLLWLPRVRRTVWMLFALSLVINAGMWMERVMIVVQSMHRDFLPSAWRMFYPTGWDWTHWGSSLCVFLTLFLLFARFLPAISIAEMRRLVHETGEQK